MIIGVLSLQGDFDAHRAMLQEAQSEGDALQGEMLRVVSVREARALAACDALVIPGGESTVMSRLCDRYDLWEPLRARLNQGMGALGTCAGMILLSQNIEGATRNFQQKTLGTLDIDVARNAYGAQADSFETDIALDTSISITATKASPDAPLPDAPLLRAVFIRAPRITRCGAGVEVLARHQGVPVVVRQGRVMATSFHPEIAGDARLHALWLRFLLRE